MFIVPTPVDPARGARGRSEDLIETASVGSRFTSTPGKQDRRAFARRSVSRIVHDQLPRRHAPLAVLFHPRKRPIGLDRLGRDLLTQNVLEDRAVDALDLDHRMPGQDLLDPALVADLALPATPASDFSGTWGVGSVDLTKVELLGCQADVRAVDWRRRESRGERLAARVAVGQRVLRILSFRRIERDRLDDEAGFVLELLGVRLAEICLELAAVVTGFLHRLAGRVHDPLRFAEERGGIDRAGDGVEDAAVRGAEVRGDV